MAEMSSSWRNWCKLCGDTEATTKIENSTEIYEINEFLKFLNVNKFFLVWSKL